MQSKLNAADAGRSTIDHSEALEAFVGEYDLLDELITSLDHDQLTLPSGCRGWNNADLVFHLLLDAQRALVTLHSPADGPSDRDYVDYWHGFQASDERSRAHARFVRISAAAHLDPTVIASRWHETARAAVRCATSAPATQLVSTQGHVLTTSDFIATLVVEGCIHHLDLVTNIDKARTPFPPARSVTRQTIEGLLAGAARPDWDEITLILKATGRRPVTNQEQEMLGETATRFPLFS